jgi:hypothetical protein
MPSFNLLGTKICTTWVCTLLQNQEPKKLFIIDTTNGIYLGASQKTPMLLYAFMISFNGVLYIGGLIKNVWKSKHSCTQNKVSYQIKWWLCQ